MAGGEQRVRGGGKQKQTGKTASVMTDVTAALASAAATLTSGLRTWLGNAVDAYRAKAEQAKRHAFVSNARRA